MSRGRARRRRDRSTEAVRRTYAAAEQLRADGAGAEAALVDVTPGATAGYEITCSGCGRTGRLPAPLPQGSAALCPGCQRERGLI